METELNSSILLTHISDRLVYSPWLGTGTSIKSGKAKLAVWVQTSPISEIMMLLHFYKKIDCKKNNTVV